MACRTDPYYWLRDDERANPEVLAYLEAENAYRERCMARGQAVRERAIRGNHRAAQAGRFQRAVPQARLLVHTRFEPGKEHPIFARRKGSLDAPEEILLDANALALGHDYYRIGALEVSPDCAVARVLRRHRRQAPIHLALQEFAHAARFSPRPFPTSSPTSHGPTTIAPFCTWKRIPRHCSACTSKSTCSARIPRHDAAGIRANGQELLHRRVQIEIRALHFHPHGKHGVLGVAVRACR